MAIKLACIDIENEIVYWCCIEPLKMSIMEWWKIICQALKLIFLQLCFNFPCKWLWLNIFVLLIFFFCWWIKGMVNPYRIQNLFRNGMYFIFQGIQFFLKFPFHLSISFSNLDIWNSITSLSSNIKEISRGLVGV